MIPAPRAEPPLRACAGRLAAVLLLALLSGACSAARVSASEADQIAAALRLREGMVVADVGAGSGEWTLELARRVGASGRVYSTEVDEDDLEEIRDAVDRAELSNVTVLRGDQHDTGLTADCCDAILLRLVYHHFTEPPAMLASLGRALRDGGRLVIIEIRPQRHWEQLEGVPDRGGHGISPADLLEEMAAQGWGLLERRVDDWDGEDEDHYCAVFRPASAP